MKWRITTIYNGVSEHTQAPDIPIPVIEFMWTENFQFLWEIKSERKKHCTLSKPELSVLSR